MWMVRFLGRIECNSILGLDFCAFSFGVALLGGWCLYDFGVGLEK